MIEPTGWRPTAREYHADREHWSPSMFAVYRESPALAWGRYVERLWPAPDPTPEMVLGSAVNAALLGLWDETVYVVQVETRSCKTYRLAQEGRPDRLVLTLGEAAAAREVAAAVLEPRTEMARLARSLLVQAQGVSEWARRWHDEQADIALKTMMDRAVWLRGPAIVELKTSADPSPRGFRQSVRRFDYAWQAAYNRRAVRLGLGPGAEQPDFFWVVVRSAPPFEVVVYRASPEMLDVVEKEQVVPLLTEVGERLRSARGRVDWCAPWELLESGYIPEIDLG